MKSIILTFKDLERYHNTIPMIKSGDKIVNFTSNKVYRLIDALPYNIDMTKEESTDLWKSILNEETTQVICIEDNNKLIAGAITVTHSPKVNMLRQDMTNAVLWDIRVHPDYQGQGLATKLINESLSYAKKQNCKKLLIETQNNNPKAIKFYLKNGATLLEENKDAYPIELNEIQYILEIDIKK